jgi:hypothetical protein
MSTKRISLAIVLALSLILIPAYGCAAPPSQKEGLITLTLEIQEAVQSELYDLDLDMLAVATQLRNTGLSGTEARQLLNQLFGQYPFLIDTCTADADAKMVTVAPDAYRGCEGTDISQQAVMVKFNDTRRPLLSQMFSAVEGMDAVVVIWPVLSQVGSFSGSLSALFKPMSLFNMKIGRRLKGTGITLNVMQLDGLTIYDSEYIDTGKNLLTDPEFQPYTELIALGHRIAAEESGTGSYTFIDHATGKLVKKQAFWVSVGLHGTEWRLVSVQQVAD